MTVFLEQYVRRPLAVLLKDVPDPLPPMTIRLVDGDSVEFDVGHDKLRIARTGEPANTDQEDMPDDVSD